AARGCGRARRPQPDASDRRRPPRRGAELRPHGLLPGAARGREGRRRPAPRAAALARDAGALGRAGCAEAARRPRANAAHAPPALRPALPRVLPPDLGDLPRADRRRGRRSRALAAALALAPLVGAP